MHDIFKLATLTASRARSAGVRPNQIVRTVCTENDVLESELDEVKKLVLSECGRRSGQVRRKKAVQRQMSLLNEPATDNTIEKAPAQQLELFLGRPYEQIRQDAENHEASLCSGLPEEDR
ncbi:MAG: hypothetical protein M0P64_00195 [Candidatus Pacebacteria bacterium]|nr:hypothetical protein [Candidatus Paceibacterota bacterium]